MNDEIWFTKAGWASVAVNAVVIVIVLMVIIFLIPVYPVIVRDGHSLSDALYPHLCILNMHCFFGEY
jgi:hypothetical protein